MALRTLFFATMVFASTTAWADMTVRKKTEVIIIHHSATPSGNVKSFRRYHVDVRGWDDIAYHFVICNGNGGPNGQIQVGRKECLQGAHARGRNHNSIGICIVGNRKNNATKLQKKALVKLINMLCEEYEIWPSTKTIVGHHRHCPHDTLNLNEIVKEVIRIRKKK